MRTLAASIAVCFCLISHAVVAMDDYSFDKGRIIQRVRDEIGANIALILEELGVKLDLPGYRFTTLEVRRFILFVRMKPECLDEYFEVVSKLLRVQQQEQDFGEFSRWRELREEMRAISYMGALLGGGAAGPDLEKSDKNPHVDYDKNGKSWQEVVAGANFGGYCKNAHCKAKGYVYMPIGKVDYLIRHGKYSQPSKCPECQKDVEVRDWGFSHCSFQIIAEKSNGDMIMRAWRKADTQYYNISMDDLGDAEYETVEVKYK